MVNKHHTRSIYIYLLGLVWCALFLFISGCGSFFEKKTTEIQAQELLNELGQVKENPNVKNSLPAIYTDPPKRIISPEGVKLFYFGRQLPVKELKAALDAQYPPPVSSSINTSTNQIIVSCPDEAKTTEIENFLGLVDVAPTQINIDCLVLERFADVTTDWETTLLIENLFGEKITAGEGKYPSPVFPGASLRESKRSEFGLDFGYWQNQGIAGHQFRAVVDMLISRGYLKILMNPVLETVNGRSAKVESREYAPLEKILVQPGFDTAVSLTDYQWVSDSLEVTPHVFSDGSIGLDTHITIGSKSKPEGVVQTSIITERTIDVNENRIEPGKSLIIGGIRKSEKRSVVRGVPFFKDLPVIGILFSSKDFEEKATEVIFILTPTISSGGMEHAKMVKDIQRMHATPDYDPGIEQVFTDPFRGSVYTEHVEKKAAKAEFERLKAEIEKAEAQDEAALIWQRAEEKAAQADAAQKQAEEMRIAAEKAQQQAEQMKQESQAVREQAQSEAEAAKAQAEVAKQEAERLKQEAEAAKAEAEKAQQQAEQMKQQSEAQSQAAQTAQAEAEKAKQDAQTAQAEAEKAKQDAEASKTQAEDQNQPPAQPQPEAEPAPAPQAEPEPAAGTEDPNAAQG